MIKQRIRLARSTLLWGLAGFVFLQLGLNLAIERRLPQFRDPFYGYRVNLLSRRTVATTTRPFTVLVLGTSRTQCGLLAHSLEQPLAQAKGRPVVVFNFGQAGAGPMTELFNLKRLLADGIRPDLLLIEVLPPLLCGQLNFQEADDLRLPTHRLRLDDLPLIKHYGGALRSNVYREWWQSVLVPWYSHRFAIFSCVAPKLVSNEARIEGIHHLDDSGCIDFSSGNPHDEPEPRSLERARLEYSAYLTGFRLGGPNCEALCEMLDLCREWNIPTALLLMPEGPQFRSWYPPVVWNTIQAYLDQISRTYRMPIINCRDWIPEQEFADSHHLRTKGATEFTRRLGQEAILPLLIKGAQEAYDQALPDGLANPDDLANKDGKRLR